jgi:hypothetical protein
MKYIKTYENFNYDSTNEGWLWGEGNIWSKIGDKISEWLNQFGQFVWEKGKSFINGIIKFFKSLYDGGKILIKDPKEVYRTFWIGHKSTTGGKDVSGIGKEFRNDVYDFLFNKSYEEVTWSDLNIENIKRVYEKTGDSLKTLFNFSDDKEKLKSREGIEDASLKLKTWFNRVLGFGVNMSFSIALAKLITSVIFTTGLAVIGSTLLAIAVVILTFLIMIGVSFISKKVKNKLQQKGYWFKDVRDVKEYDPNTDNPVSISKISGFSDYTDRVEDSDKVPSDDVMNYLDNLEEELASQGCKEIEKNGFDLPLAA